MRSLVYKCISHFVHTHTLVPAFHNERKRNEISTNLLATVVMFCYYFHSYCQESGFPIGLVHGAITSSATHFLKHQIITVNISFHDRSQYLQEQKRLHCYRK